ncbi:MAG: 2Fe-2S iron-sulfur cluster binding domain-containing protein [Chloroflexi bacterium]|nr:2Fe-2S iron-sulfur cluster binding domain-containing protein [Chloroflexota bacterium]
MQLNLTINNESKTWDIAPNETLLHALRAHGYFGVKHGCENGECGACAVLIDGQPMNSCMLLAAQAEGKQITTIESLGQVEEQGWKHTAGLHPLQQAFVEIGAIQCGYCTPAQILAAKALLDQTLTPTEDQVRDALSGVLCRCTGYVKPVQAVLLAAEKLRGEQRLETRDWRLPPSESPISNLQSPISTTIVGKPEIKVDAVKLAQGKPAFTDDIELRGMLYAKVLHSPIAHARIKRIDASKARALDGVRAVLTHQDIPRVVYSTAGQSDPIPGPLDSFSLDHKVRFVGDRVAFVAADTEEIAERALELIQVEYEELPAIIDSRDAMKPGAPRIHDEPEYVNFFDVAKPERNIAAHINIELGNIAEGFKQADHIFEDEYVVPKVQQAHIEPHVVVTYWDEDDRLVIRTSTQVPFHARRILAPVLGLPPKRIRVIKPRIGGGFGGKQEVLVEDVAAHLTIATGRPVRFEYTREEEFIAARSRHPMRIRVKTGVTKDGKIIANEMYALSDTGAYGCHALTVTGNTGQKTLNLYNAPNIKFEAHVVYTNTPPSGAYRGYGVPQGFFPLEVHIEKIARALGFDPLEFRLKNAVKSGDELPMSKAWNEGRPPHPEKIETCGLAECVARGAQALGFKVSKFKVQSSTLNLEPRTSNWRLVPGKPHLRRGQGVACVMQGTAIPYLDMGGASIKINDDGSFNLLVGATDLGTGSDTVLAQLAAEILGCPIDDIIVYSSDTDFTPFDKGAYASSTTYISGGAVVRAANDVAEQIRKVAARMLNDRRPTTDDGYSAVSGQRSAVMPEQIVLRDRCAFAPDGCFVTLADVALESLHHKDQQQIMAVASYVSPKSPPPFAAQYAQVLVDTETGQITVEKLVMAVDSGVIVNPATASGQIEGGMTQALGYAVCEEMLYDARGDSVIRQLGDYKIFAADEMPELQTIFVETFEPSHPFGLKAVAEIPLDGVAPAVANAVHDAVGIWMNEIPMTPERVWRTMNQ